MTRVDRIAPFIEAMSDDTFETFLAAAAGAVTRTTVYEMLGPEAKAEIDAAIARLDRGEGVPYATLKLRLEAKLKTAGA